MNAATLTGPSPPSPREPPIVLRRRAPSPARRSPGAAGPTRPARPHSTRRYRRPAPGPPIGRDPVPQSALVDPEIPGHLSDRLTGLPYDPDRPSPELLIKLASRLGHYTASLLRVPPGYEGKPRRSAVGCPGTGCGGPRSGAGSRSRSVLVVVVRRLGLWGGHAFGSGWVWLSRRTGNGRGHRYRSGRTG